MIGNFSNNHKVDAEELWKMRSVSREISESESHTISEAHLKDKKYIEELERELRNCSQEIGYLQDQLNLRSVEANFMNEHVHSLELKLADVGKLHERIRVLNEELVRSNSECLILMRELKCRKEELQYSAWHMERLEASVSSMSLDLQCEIESMKLDMTSLEQKCLEAERSSQEATEEKSRLVNLLEEVKLQFEEAQQVISSLEKENSKLQETVVISENNGEGSSSKAEEVLYKWPNQDGRTSGYIPGELDKALSLVLRNKLSLSKEMCLCSSCQEISDPFNSKLAAVVSGDDNLKDEIEKMLKRIQEFELSVKQLKEELRQEKLKAKEEAEDLIQEMAELRYQMTGMLEEESKRRACIEQASLQRIQDLESQVRREQSKYAAALMRFQEAEELAEKQSMEIRQLKKALKAYDAGTKLEKEAQIVCSSRGHRLYSITETPQHVEDLDLTGSDSTTMNQALLEWYSAETYTSKDKH